MNKFEKLYKDIQYYEHELGMRLDWNKIKKLSWESAKMVLVMLERKWEKTK